MILSVDRPKEQMQSWFCLVYDFRRTAKEIFVGLLPPLTIYGRRTGGNPH